MIPSPLLPKLKMVASGTSLRQTLDEIVKADFGSLLVFLDDIASYEPVLQGGFKVNCDFSGPKLYELAKMDGAVVINDTISKIYKANVHLIPEPSTPTEETGMRHRAAEQTAKQTGMLTIAISRRRKTITVYYKSYRHRLNDLNYLLTRVSLALETLEKQAFTFHQLIAEISVEEIESQVKLSNVIQVILKACEMMRISRDTEPYLIETGTEGHLYCTQFNGISSEILTLLRVLIMDYSARNLKDYEVSSMMKALSNLAPSDQVVTARMLGWNLLTETEVDDHFISPRCYRFLTRTVRLPMAVARNVINVFPNIKKLKEQKVACLQKIEGIGDKRAKAIRMSMKSLGQKSGYR